MNKVVSSKNMDGITDLVVVAPIKQGFIEAYENVTYATRLKIVAEALNRVRVAAREHEMITPFSDVTERILTLLDFRVGVIDKDLFALEVKSGGDDDAARALESRRYLYLTATFDGAWEPYMRLIWDPLGPFLDLLFCNCEDYITASEHSFDEYAQWVRDNQVNSAIFYAATGLGVRDQLYLNRLEQVLRARPAALCEREIAGMTMPNPELSARAERLLAASDPAHAARIHELALEALTVLYRLADYYPPEWIIENGLKEGHFLMRAAESLLLGWEKLIPPQPWSKSWMAIEQTYAEPLGWYRTGIRHLRELEAEREATRPPDKKLDYTEIQGGVLKSQGTLEEPMHQGALLLMTIVDTMKARSFLRMLEASDQIHFEDGAGSKPADGFFRTVALTADGLQRLGLKQAPLDWFPKEFREGMEMRSGLVGDVRENHPRRWALPKRNWPPVQPGAGPLASARPPIETSEIDIVLQIRTTSEDRQELMKEITRLAEIPDSGVTLQGYEPMCAAYDEKGLLLDYFGFHDGISQPRPEENRPDGSAPDPAEPAYRDEVRLGETLLGYRNDRDDFAPAGFSPDDWRTKHREKARELQFNGTFLVIRKLEQRVESFNALIRSETARINLDHPGLPTPMTEERLKARMLGRYSDGTPLIQTADADRRNDFDFRKDPEGLACPHAAHIRRTNPREPFQGRNAPRIMRRGMSFDHRDDTGAGPRGLMFMAYNASIAEQFETIQRWINGGNSTAIASGHNDPILGVAPKSGELNKVERVFRFVEGNEVVRVTMPQPFVALHWGLYLFVPSRTALRAQPGLNDFYQPFRETLETEGRTVIGRLKTINNMKTKTSEWKRLLEDFDAKDPSEGNVTPDVWSAIRYFYGGSFKIPSGTASRGNWDSAPDEDLQPIVLAASWDHVMKVLSNWEVYSTEEQLRRLEPPPRPGGGGTAPPDPVGIPIFVAQQPQKTGEEPYRAHYLRGRFDYRAESEPTNKILMDYDYPAGFVDGYEAGSRILNKARGAADQLGRKSFKLELRRQYLLPALGELCKIWYGLPDNQTFHEGGWTWQPPEKRSPPGPRCPGDFLSPSRNAFYPRPTKTVNGFADLHREAVRQGSLDFVKKHRQKPRPPGLGRIAEKMFAAFPNSPADDKILARNLVGTMIGAIPPMDGNLRGILLEWLLERTLWRHQAALRHALGDQLASTNPQKACDILKGPVSKAMCRRPAPDLIYRTAIGETTLEASGGRSTAADNVAIKEGDLVVVSLVSASQRSLDLDEYPDGDVSIVFGGERRDAWEGQIDPQYPVHACPAQKLAMGAIMGILAALLDVGRIQALPASLIVRISDWPR